MANVDIKLEDSANVENTEPKPDDSADLAKRIKQLETENAKLKQSVTNASADASKWKKEYQAKLTDEEKAKAEQEAATAAMQQELEMLRTRTNVADHKAQFISVGFDTDLAQEVAESFKNVKAEDLTVLFDGIRKFIASHDKELAAKSLLANPVLSGGNAPKKMTQAEFDKMGYTERVKLYNEDPELYKEMTKSTS